MMPTTNQHDGIHRVRRYRMAALVVATAAALALAPGAAQAQPELEADFTPGAPGIGDPYFPLDGNGGYDVRHYLLEVAYDPDTDVLTGKATISARATQNLSSFNLDFDGLTVRSITVDGRSADWSRAGDELTVTPRSGIRKGTRFTTVVEYDGVPEPIEDAFGLSGFLHTDDGALVLGQPHVADTWFPVNDHPIDKASYTISITVPEGLEAISNGVLRLATHPPRADHVDVGCQGADGVLPRDDGDRRVRRPRLPRGRPEVLGRARPGPVRQAGAADRRASMRCPRWADLSYKRLTQTINVPAGGAELSFWITRDTEPTGTSSSSRRTPPGRTTGRLSRTRTATPARTPASSAPSGCELHPFLEHYQTPAGDTCDPSGTTGEWWAATGASDGYEQWTVDLSAFAAATSRCRSATRATTSSRDRAPSSTTSTVSTGEGTTSFEDDGDTFDGWTVPGAPEGSEPNPNDWIAGTIEDAPPSLGEVAEGSFARQPEIIDFLEGYFGRYPFSAAGGVVDDLDELGFALETQTRPIYAEGFFGDSMSGDSVVVHELAHQWVGDYLALEEWQHIWLNEGFATYAEWLWAEYEGFATTQEIFDDFATIPADDPLWSVTIGDPGPDDLFNFAVYFRGAMTLQALRVEVGDDDFFRILKRWIASQAGGNVTTDEFIALAERISGQQLDELFEVWLFTPEKPAVLEAAAARAQSGATSLGPAPSPLDKLAERVGVRR